LKTKELKARTSGKFVVTELLGLNQEEDVVIFTANTEAESKVQHIYAVKNEDGAEKVCLTCGSSKGHSYYTAEVSKNGGNMAVIASGPDVPQVHISTLKVDGNNITLTSPIEIEMNSHLKQVLADKKIPNIVFDKIKLDNGSESQVMMYLPADLDERSKYPMIVEVYGGPDSSSVTTRWAVEWGSYLTSAHNIIYVKIDGRGSGLRGDKNLFELYRRLGTVEVHDQIETAQKLQEKYSYIDAKRSAIWGWSYGGYVSGMSLATDKNEVFKCAVSVAPGNIVDNSIENFSHLFISFQ
jgi:dipeptidyl-peptidase 4